jgi:hypothetical protein
MDAVLNGVEDGSIVVDSLISVTDLSNNRNVVPPGSSFPWWIIVLAAVGAIVLVTVIIFIVCAAKRRKTRSDDKMAFLGAPLNEDSYTPLDTMSRKQRTKVNLKVIFANNNNHGLENVLKLRRDDLGTCDIADWVNDEEWVWMTSLATNESGYFPKEWVREI